MKLTDFIKTSNHRKFDIGHRGNYIEHIKGNDLTKDISPITAYPEKMEVALWNVDIINGETIIIVAIK